MASNSGLELTRVCEDGMPVPLSLRRRAGRSAGGSRASAVRLLIVAAIALVTVACSDAGEFDRRISSPDERYVSDVARELDAAGIDFRARRDGSIAYRGRDEHLVKPIEERLKKDAERAPAKR